MANPSYLGLKQGRIMNKHKWLNHFLVLFLLCFATCGSAVHAAIAGDIAPRGATDDQLTLADVLLTEQAILGVITDLTNEELRRIDVAPTGGPNEQVDVGDLILLEQALLGQISLADIILPAPILDSLPSTTTESLLTVTGQATPDAQVLIFVNEVAQGNFFAEADGSFSINVILTVGNNDIRVAAWDGNQEGLNAEQAIEYTVPQTVDNITFRFFGDEDFFNQLINFGSGSYLTFKDIATISGLARDSVNQPVADATLVFTIQGAPGISTTLTLITGANGSYSGVLHSPDDSGSLIRPGGACVLTYDRHDVIITVLDGPTLSFVTVSHSTGSNFDPGNSVRLNDIAQILCGG